MRRKHMKVFISWSGNVSWKVAVIFRDWLPLSYNHWNHMFPLKISIRVLDGALTLQKNLKIQHLVYLCNKGKFRSSMAIF